MDIYNQNKNVWEEKTIIEPPKKFDNQIDLNLKNIILKTQKKLKANECSHTGQKNIIRNCPTCNKKIYYTTESGLKIATKNKTICYACSNRIKENYIGKKIGNLLITNQYLHSNGRTLVDYECQCKAKTIKIGAFLSNLKNQKYCKKM
jgi:hypothetical protein